MKKIRMYEKKKEQIAREREESRRRSQVG